MANKIIFEHIEKQDYARREAMNSLRTNLQFCGVDNKVIMFTSCTPNEGKSTVTVELARSLSEDGKKVILIDADLRKSVLVGRYRLHSRKRYTDYHTSFPGRGKKRKSSITQTFPIWI